MIRNIFSSIFSVQLRATASNGIIMFTTNNKHTDHLALYLVNGYVHFAYNSGSGQVNMALMSVFATKIHQKMMMLEPSFQLSQ